MTGTLEIAQQASSEGAVSLLEPKENVKALLQEFEKETLSLALPRRQPLPVPVKQLQLRFWGTRGSIPVSGAAHLRYGGNTSCVSLTSDSGHLFIFDCGSGARDLGNYLMSGQWLPINKSKNLENQSDPKEIDGYMLLSHTHWDHIQGFPFFAPLFQKSSRFNVLGWSDCAETLAGIMAGQMQHNYFPVSLENLPSQVAFHPLQSQQNLNLDGAKLTAGLLKHPLPSLGYRLELGGKVVVYATDHEPHGLPTILPPHTLLGEDIIDRGLVELARNADILIHDAQYSIVELAQKVGWGHNSAEIAVDTAIKAGVKQLVLYHHDPAHDDTAVDALLALAQARAASLNSKLQVIAAYDGLALDLL